MSQSHDPLKISNILAQTVFQIKLRKGEVWVAYWKKYQNKFAQKLLLLENYSNSYLTGLHEETVEGQGEFTFRYCTKRFKHEPTENIWWLA